MRTSSRHSQSSRGQSLPPTRQNIMGVSVVPLTSGVRVLIFLHCVLTLNFPPTDRFHCLDKTLHALGPCPQGDGT